MRRNLPGWWRTDPASAAFHEQYARFGPSIYDGWAEPDFQVHTGDLVLEGDFTAPGLATLILGNLTVAGYVDLRNDENKGFDEGGVFVVLGSVRCRVFAGHYGKCSFVDGDLTAQDLLLNAYEDSSLIVTGHLRTNFFFGHDIWAEVGAGAAMSYGDGTARPLGSDAGPAAIRPRHDEATSLALLAEDDPDTLKDLTAGDLMELVRTGQPVFR